MPKIRYSINRRLKNILPSEGNNTIGPGIIRDHRTPDNDKANELTDRFIKSMAKTLEVPEEMIDEKVAKKWAKGWRSSFMKKEGRRFEDMIRDIARESKRLSKDKLATRYAKGIHKVTGEPLERIKKSKPVKNFVEKMQG